MINGQLLKLAPIEVMANLPYFLLLILHMYVYVRSSIISCQDDKLTILRHTLETYTLRHTLWDIQTETYIFGGL